MGKYSRIHTVLFAILLFAMSSQASMAYSGYSPYTPYSTYPSRSLPNALDIMESGLYWMRDWSGAENNSDPASIISLVEEQITRFFDLGRIAEQVGGPYYASLNILDRAHFQNRIRDRLFRVLAGQFGMLNNRFPRYTPLMPIYSGAGTIMFGSTIWHPNGKVNRVYFHLYLSPRGWRVYDVSNNGITATSQLRQLFLKGHFKLID